MAPTLAEALAPGAGSEPFFDRKRYLSHQVGLFWLWVDWARVRGEEAAQAMMAMKRIRRVVFIETPSFRR